MVYALYPACGCTVLNLCSVHGFNYKKIIFQSIGDIVQKLCDYPYFHISMLQTEEEQK